MAEALGNKRKYILLPSTTTDWTCTICKRAIHFAPVYQAPVYQCKEGHLSCSVCHKNGKCCTLCPTDDAPSSMRNLAIETIMESIGMTCKLAPLGCKEIGKFKEKSKSDHEFSCLFQPMECPMPGCLQAGVVHGLPEHLLTKHNISSLVDFEGDDAKHAVKIELKPSTSLVVLRKSRSWCNHPSFWKHYLLHQDSTTYGETLRITALKEKSYGIPTFKLEVLSSDKDGTYLYSFKSIPTISKQQGGMLIIPKQPVGDTFKCKVTLLEDDEDDEDDEVDFDKDDD